MMFVQDRRRTKKKGVFVLLSPPKTGYDWRMTWMSKTTSPKKKLSMFVSFKDPCELLSIVETP